MRRVLVLGGIALALPACGTVSLGLRLGGRALDKESVTETIAERPVATGLRLGVGSTRPLALACQVDTTYDQTVRVSYRASPVTRAILFGSVAALEGLGGYYAIRAGREDGSAAATGFGVFLAADAAVALAFALIDFPGPDPWTMRQTEVRPEPGCPVGLTIGPGILVGPGGTIAPEDERYVVEHLLNPTQALAGQAGALRGSVWLTTQERCDLATAQRHPSAPAICALAIVEGPAEEPDVDSSSSSHGVVTVPSTPAERDEPRPIVVPSEPAKDDGSKDDGSKDDGSKDGGSKDDDDVRPVKGK